MRFFTPAEKPQAPVVDSQRRVDEKENGLTTEPTPIDTDNESISKDAQAGVQDIEAITTVWTRNHLIIAYILIWIIHFVDAMQQGMGFALAPYITSSFQYHSLTATTSIVSSLVGGIFKLPLAKILDIWGRPQGFITMLIALEIGIIMMAACQNVQTYAAAQVFYWVGNNGVGFTLGVFVADTSALKNRAFMFAFISSPYIATVWIGGPLATALLKGPGFRWGFGIFAIVTLVVCLPLYALFIYNYRKAKKAGLIPERKSGRSFFQSVKFYLIEFDVFGILLISAGISLFLLPFNLVFNQPLGWKSPLIICMIIFGIVFMACFAIWEKFFAPVKFMPWELLTDRTVLGACTLAATLFISFYVWDSFFISFLQVVNNLTITQTSYIGNIYSIGSCFWALVTGVLVRWTGRFKWLAMYFGMPLTILGVALMINFRQPDLNIGYIIMCQIFIALAGGTLVICDQIAAMAATSHQYIAVVLAVESMFSNIGGAIGSTIAGAIWQGVFPERLLRYLPEESQGNFTEIYGQLPVQLAYPVGSPTRDAINRAYGDAQRFMLIGGSTVLIVAVVAVAVWRDIKVKEFKQVKGTVI